MRTVLFPTAIVTLLAFGSFAPGQPPTQPQPPDRPATIERETMLGERFSFMVRVPSVTLDVVVADDRGRFVTGLAADDFEVLEDGVPQEIRYFTADLTPVTSLLLLDSSASVRSSLSAIQTAAYLFLRNMATADQGRVATFSEGVRFGPPYASDIWDQIPMIRAMRPFGRTALYDAILTSLQELSRVEERKALILVSDGEVSGTAIEVPMRLVVTLEVMPNPRGITEPEYETDEYYAVTGFDPSIDEAAKKATRHMIAYLVAEHGLTPEEAYVLCSLAGDLKISETVDVPNMLVSMHMPKSIFGND